MMAEPMRSPPSVSTISLLRGAKEHPQPCFTPKQSRELKGAPLPTAWTSSQPLHPRRGEPGSAIQLFQDLQQEELFAFFPPLTFFHGQNKPNRASADPWPALCHDGFVSWSNQDPLGLAQPGTWQKERLLSSEHTPTPPSPASHFLLSQPAMGW